MKIIVLAGGLSPERDVSLTSGAGICKTLLENGHQAYLLDLYFGLENAPANLEDVFTLPGAGLEIAKNISTKEPDLEALKKSRPDQSDCMFGPNVIELCRMADPAERHPTAGTVAIGARMPLVAYNINLNTPSLEIAHDIAKKIRFIGGGLRYCKAMGVELKDRGITQVSINMTDYTRTALYRAFELVRVEARRYGVSIVGSEIIGLVPMEALIDTASYYLGLENFSMEQVLEARM